MFSAAQKLAGTSLNFCVLPWFGGMGFGSAGVDGVIGPVFPPGFVFPPGSVLPPGLVGVDGSDGFVVVPGSCLVTV